MSRFSWLCLSGIVQTRRYPFSAAAIARPTPVLPLVGSTIVPPGFSRPRFSASSIIARPIRSFTEPPGLSISSFATRRGRRPLPIRLSCTRGVLPTRPRMSGAMVTGSMLVRAGLQKEVRAGQDDHDRREIRFQVVGDRDGREGIGERDQADDDRER